VTHAAPKRRGDASPRQILLTTGAPFLDSPRLNLWPMTWRDTSAYQGGSGQLWHAVNQEGVTLMGGLQCHRSGQFEDHR
jgi:hypothetical protein